jgi:FkbM family methyltransferase
VNIQCLTSITESSIYDDKYMSELINTPKHNDLIYDIGMHKGEDTEFYLHKGFRVVAIEADPDLVSSCRNRFKNFIDQGQLKIVEGAIVDPTAIEADQKKVQFYKNDDVSVWGTICSNWIDRNVRIGTSSRTIEVDAINFSSVIQEHGIPQYIKIDIEGCDMICINTLRNFQERPDYVSIESDKTSFGGIEREIDTLTDLGYDYFQAIEQSGINLSQSPPYPAREGKYISHRFEHGSSGLFGAELDNKWKSKHDILRQYRTIWLGYYLLGDKGILNKWKFLGSGKLRGLVRRFLSLFTKASVPGWYDTHAIHSSANIMNS